MSGEAEAEAMSLNYSGRVFNPHAPDVQPEALAMTTDAVPHMGAKATPTASMPAAGVVAPKNNLPALDLLHWSETPSLNPSRSRISATNDSSAFMNASDESPLIQIPIRSEVRTSQPAGGISTISFGANLTPEECEQLQKRRPGSDSKRREMIGSRIFDQDSTSEPAPDLNAKKTLPAGPVAQPTGPVTLIRYGSAANTEDPCLSPKKPVSLAEMAKQRELSGTFFGSGNNTPSGRRPNSSAKCRELEGSNIFGRSSQDLSRFVTPKPLASDLKNCQDNSAPPRTSVKVSNPAGGRSQIIFGCDGGQEFGSQGKKQGLHQKAEELSGHGIFKDEANTVLSNNAVNHMERVVSAAKEREMIGNDIFSDSSPISEDRPRRARQPPGGESNLKLY